MEMFVSVLCDIYYRCYLVLNYKRLGVYNRADDANCTHPLPLNSAHVVRGGQANVYIRFILHCRLGQDSGLFQRKYGSEA